MSSRLRMAHNNPLLSLLVCLRLLTLSFPIMNLFFYVEAAVWLEIERSGAFKTGYTRQRNSRCSQKNSRETRRNGSHAFNNHIRQAIVLQVPPAILWCDWFFAVSRACIQTRTQEQRRRKFAGKTKDIFSILEPFYHVVWKRRWRKKAPSSKKAFSCIFVAKFDKINSASEKLNLCFTSECFVGKVALLDYCVIDNHLSFRRVKEDENLNFWMPVFDWKIDSF